MRYFAFFLWFTCLVLLFPFFARYRAMVLVTDINTEDCCLCEGIALSSELINMASGAASVGNNKVRFLPLFPTKNKFVVIVGVAICAIRSSP